MSLRFLGASMRQGQLAEPVARVGQVESHVAVQELIDLVLDARIRERGGRGGLADAPDQLERRRAVVEQRLDEALAASVGVHVDGIVPLVADHGLLVEGHDVVDLVHEGHQVGDDGQVRAAARVGAAQQREDEVGKGLGHAALEAEVAGEGGGRLGGPEPVAALDLDEVGAEELEDRLDDHVAVPGVVVLLADLVGVGHERPHDFGVHRLAGDEPRAVRAQGVREQVAQVVDGEGQGGEDAELDLQLARVLGVEPPRRSRAELRDHRHPPRRQFLVQAHVDDLLVELIVLQVGGQLEAGLREEGLDDLLVCGQGYRRHLFGWYEAGGARTLPSEAGRGLAGHGDLCGGHSVVGAGTCLTGRGGTGSGRHGRDGLGAELNGAPRTKV